jgi:hypothetical protein
MSKVIDILKEIESKLDSEKGPFTLFAMFEREDFPSRWDLVVAAPWVESDNAQALRFLAAEMKQRLPTNDFERVSRIVLLDPADERVRAITSENPVEHGSIEIDEASRYGLPAEHGYIITARSAA